VTPVKRVVGRRILHVGCGSGAQSAALRDRGAVVTGIDASAGTSPPKTAVAPHPRLSVLRIPSAV
jgi:2-polyprenyl-3-methyl-5-hydroxy-6-metoxy-1,4-benzoquinol methylase